MVEVVRVAEVVRMVGEVGVDGEVWVLTTKTSQQQEQQGLYLLLDHAAGGW